MNSKIAELSAEQLDEILSDVITEALELEPDELEPEGRFIEEYGGDSLRAIEILAQLEKRLGIEIPQERLPEMVNLNRVRDVVLDLQ